MKSDAEGSTALRAFLTSQTALSSSVSFFGFFLQIFLRSDLPVSIVSTLLSSPRYQSFSSLATFFATRRWRRLRWGAHISHEQAYRKVAALRLSAGRPRTFLTFGDGAFSSSSRGHASGPVNMMYAKLRASQLLQVRKVWEFRTSRVCFRCHGGFSGRSKAWALEKCRNVCRWNRDGNAPCNMLHLAFHQEENEGARMLGFNAVASEADADVETAMTAEAGAGTNETYDQWDLCGLLSKDTQVQKGHVSTTIG